MDNQDLAIRTRGLNLWYGTFQALFDVDLDIKQGIITSLIGPSGCGKSTLLRSINRINERLGYVRATGTIDVCGHNILGDDVELLQVRKQVGMVFQRPIRSPFPSETMFCSGIDSIRRRRIGSRRASRTPSFRARWSKSCCGTR